MWAILTGEGEDNALNRDLLDEVAVLIGFGFAAPCSFIIGLACINIAALDAYIQL